MIVDVSELAMEIERNESCIEKINIDNTWVFEQQDQEETEEGINNIDKPWTCAMADSTSQTHITISITFIFVLLKSEQRNTNKQTKSSFSARYFFDQISPNKKGVIRFSLFCFEQNIQQVSTLLLIFCCPLHSPLSFVPEGSVEMHRSRRQVYFTKDWRV
jgi:hypothetical protein